MDVVILVFFYRLSDAKLHPDRFIEERARKSLRALTSVGARPAGSYENEVTILKNTQDATLYSTLFRRIRLTDDQ